MRLFDVALGLATAMGFGYLVYRRPWRHAAPSASDIPSHVKIEEGPVPNVPAGEKAAHVWARPIVKQALQQLLGRDPALPEIQYGQSIGWLESSYGKGWGKPRKACVEAGMAMDIPGSQASNNWGAVHAVGSEIGFAWCDTNAAGKPYAQRFRSYPSPLDGAKDKLRNTFVARKAVAAAVTEPGATVWRASLAMRRGIYYSAWCPKAITQHGAGAAKTSKQKEPQEADGSIACEREAAGMHVKEAYGVMRKIAASLGEPVSMPLGTYEDAVSWYNARKVSA